MGSFFYNSAGICSVFQCFQHGSDGVMLQTLFRFTLVFGGEFVLPRVPNKKRPPIVVLALPARIELTTNP